MNKPRVVIIGANEFQKRLVQKARELGFETHVFAWEEGAVAKQISDFFYPISITEKEKILDHARKINPIGICSIASDLAVPTVNYVANKLGLTANSLECTKLTTNKYEMRKIFQENNLPSTKYQLIEHSMDIDFSQLKFPLIVKPVDRSGSRGIYKVNNLNSISYAIKKCKEVSFSQQVLIEEYIEGKEYSVEMITHQGTHHFLQVTEKFTTGEPNFIERGHLAPARIPDQVKDELIKIICFALDVLKIQNGASHSEVKITPDGKIKIIEIASRMGGDFIGSDLVYLTTGIDFLKNVLNIATNRSLDLKKYTVSKNAFVGFLFDEKDITQFEHVKRLYPDVLQEYQINKRLKTVTDSATRNGYYILKNIDDDQINEILTILKMDVEEQIYHE